MITIGLLVGDGSGDGEPQSGGLNIVTRIYTFNGFQLNPIVAPKTMYVAKSLNNITSKLAMWQFTAMSSFISSKQSPLQTTRALMDV